MFNTEFGERFISLHMECQLCGPSGSVIAIKLKARSIFHMTAMLFNVLQNSYRNKSCIFFFWRSIIIWNFRILF